LTRQYLTAKGRSLSPCISKTSQRFQRAIRTKEHGAELLWVRGHQGTEDNEEADYRAKIAAKSGRLMNQPSIATPAGIRQTFKLYQPSTQARWWYKDTLKGLTYIVTDKGPFKC